MKHPKPEKLRSIARMFRNIYINEKATELDFNMSRIRPTSCGTVACHGGWFIYGLEGPDVRGRYYADGVELLNKHLMGEVDWDFSFWARENPNLWGNTLGGTMFLHTGYLAFDSTEEDCTLLTIADHYEAVATRIEELK